MEANLFKNQFEMLILNNWEQFPFPLLVTLTRVTHNLRYGIRQLAFHGLDMVAILPSKMLQMRHDMAQEIRQKGKYLGSLLRESRYDDWGGVSVNVDMTHIFRYNGQLYSLPQGLGLNRDDNNQHMFSSMMFEGVETNYFPETKKKGKYSFTTRVRAAAIDVPLERWDLYYQWDRQVDRDENDLFYYSTINGQIEVLCMQCGSHDGKTLPGAIERFLYYQTYNIHVLPDQPICLRSSCDEGRKHTTTIDPIFVSHRVDSKEFVNRVRNLISKKKSQAEDNEY